MRVIGRKKIGEIREKIAEKGLDAALFINSEPVLDSNIAYLSGFSGMLSGALIVDPESIRLITTGIDYDRAKEEASADEISKCKDSFHLFQNVKGHCESYRKVGVVKNKFTVEMAERTGMGPSRLADVRLLMERTRMVKGRKEIELIRKSADICNKGIKFLEGFIREGVKENEVAAELERQMKSMGSECPPFETIVTSGSRSFFIHPNPPASGMSIKQGPGLVDFGAVYRNYSTDVTVPFAAGKLNERQQEMAQVVTSLWDDIRKKIKPFVKTSTLHNMFEKMVQKSGFDVKHSLGHSLGLEVHEYPSVSGTETELKKGMVLAIEPGVYERGSGGCRLSHPFLFTRIVFSSLQPPEPLSYTPGSIARTMPLFSSVSVPLTDGYS